MRTRSNGITISSAYFTRGPSSAIRLLSCMVSPAQLPRIKLNLAHWRGLAHYINGNELLTRDHKVSRWQLHLINRRQYCRRVASGVSVAIECNGNRRLQIRKVLGT